MKKIARVLMTLLVCLACLFSPAYASEAGGADPAAEDGVVAFSLEQLEGDGLTEGEAAAETEPAAGTGDEWAEVDEPEVRWAYGIPLSQLQSPYLTLVNAERPLDKDFEPTPMVKMSMVKRATSATVYLQETAAKALQAMFEAALQVTRYDYVELNNRGEEVQKTATFDNGMVLYLKSGYRSYGTQATTYANYLARNNNVDDGYVAKPGASEHQSGLCCDILNQDYAGRDRMTQDFKYTPEAQWMKNHCAEFGFILRFPEDKEDETGIKFEPWHFRYVGQTAAGYITSTGISFEEFTTEWEAALKDFEERGGDVAIQLAYEEARLNAPPASYILDKYGVDGDAEISLVF